MERPGPPPAGSESRRRRVERSPAAGSRLPPPAGAPGPCGPLLSALRAVGSAENACEAFRADVRSACSCSPSPASTPQVGLLGRILPAAEPVAGARRARPRAVRADGAMPITHATDLRGEDMHDVELPQRVFFDEPHRLAAHTPQSADGIAGEPFAVDAGRRCRLAGALLMQAVDDGKPAGCREFPAPLTAIFRTPWRRRYVRCTHAISLGISSDNGTRNYFPPTGIRRNRTLEAEGSIPFSSTARPRAPRAGASRQKPPQGSPDVEQNPQP